MTVTAWSTISVDAAVYSVPSRFIGQRLKVLAYYDRIKIFYGRHLVHEASRQASGRKSIQYRHLIFHLLRKPGAFRNYQFREELFPRLVFRQAYDRLLLENEQSADKEYLRILHQAAVESETAVAIALQELIDREQLPSSESVKRICEKTRAVPNVEVLSPTFDAYDNLLNISSTPWKESNP